MHTRVVLLGQGHPRRSLCQPDGILVLPSLVQHYFRYRHHHPSDSCTKSLESAQKTEVRIDICLRHGRIVRPFCFPLSEALRKFDDSRECCHCRKIRRAGIVNFSQGFGPKEIVKLTGLQRMHNFDPPAPFPICRLPFDRRHLG